MTESQEEGGKPREETGRPSFWQSKRTLAILDALDVWSTWLTMREEGCATMPFKSVITQQHDEIDPVPPAKGEIPDMVLVPNQSTRVDWTVSRTFSSKLTGKEAVLAEAVDSVLVNYGLEDCEPMLRIYFPRGGPCHGKSQREFRPGGIPRRHEMAINEVVRALRDGLRD